MKQEYYLTHVQEEMNVKVVDSGSPGSLMFLVKNNHQQYQLCELWKKMNSQFLQENKKMGGFMPKDGVMVESGGKR
jgi:hypothetical protein